MQGIGYTFKVWLSVLLFTPVVFLLLLGIIPGYHIPELIGFIFITYVIPYTCIVSVWVGLSLFCGIYLLRNYNFIKLKFKFSLSLFTTAIIFLGFIMLRHIPAVMMYRDDFILPLACAITTIIFIGIYDLGLVTDDTKAKAEIAVSRIKMCFIYSVLVWLITFTLSVPLALVVLFFTKGFSPGSLKNAIKSIIEHYQIQLNISIAFLITLLLISLAVSNLNLSQLKKKMWILLFACPLSLPAYFYYQLFSGAIIQFSIFELMALTFPSLLVSIAAITLMTLKPTNA